MTSDDFFGNMQRHLNDELPFVIYRKPNESQLKSLLQNDSTLHYISDFNDSGFVMAPFNDLKETILIPTSESRSLKTEFVAVSNIKPSGKHQQDLSKIIENQKQAHIELVKEAITTINKNALQKVVVSRRENVELTDANPIEIFKKLLNSYPSAFVYCWYHPKVGLWLGATPEMFLNIEGNRLRTMSLAGTQNFKGSEEIVWQDKEKKEQQFVTDFIVSNLKSLLKYVNVSDAKTIRAGNLFHLKTEIKATLKPEASSLKKIIQHLHPTPAVCGLPKERAKQFILENENYARDYYTGFLGELNFKEKKSRNSNKHNVENDAYAVIKNVTSLYVNLRCMQIKEHQAIIYVGGGITKDSNPQNEWEETVSKSQVIKSVL